jgi:hypothetical protein
VKCPICEREGRESTVRVGPSTVTLAYCAPFYGQDGAYHHHDTNTTTTQLACSNGHAFLEKRRSRCPAPGCLWGGDSWIVE